MLRNDFGCKYLAGCAIGGSQSIGELFIFDESSKRSNKMAFGGRNRDQVVCGYLSYDHIHITGATSYALG